MGGEPDYGADGRTAPIAAMADFIMRWTECLHGAGDLRATLLAFADCTSVAVVALHRTNLATCHQRTIAAADPGAAQGGRPYVRAFGPALVTVRPETVRLGSVWTLSEIDLPQQDALDHRAMRWMEDRSLRDAGVVPLGRTGGEMDFLEFYAALPFRPRDRALLAVLAAAVAAAWGRREKGRIARLLRAAPAIDERLNAHRDADAAPLSPANPWGLTPAELRICQMIQGGADPAEISARSHVSPSTVRSHLRSIYAKARVTGQVGLVRRLLADGAGGRDAPRRSAGS